LEDNGKELYNGGVEPGTPVYAGGPFSRGKIFENVEPGTINNICIYSSGIGDVLIGLRQDATENDLQEVTIQAAKENDWNCANANIEWTAPKLFIYKKSGVPVISFSKAEPFDSYTFYQDVWYKNNIKMAFKIVFSGSKQRKNIGYSELGNGQGELKKGWNHFGSATASFKLSDYKGDCDIKIAYTYDNQNKQYSIVQEIYPGKGYWIYSRNECSLALVSAATGSGTFSVINAVLVVNDINSLTEKEQDFLDGLKIEYKIVDVISYEDAAAGLEKYKTIFIIEYNEKLSVDKIYEAYNKGAVINLLGDASRYVQDIPTATPARNIDYKEWD